MNCVSWQDPSDGGKTGGNAQSRVLNIQKTLRLIDVFYLFFQKQK
jgi:hypothetical protein